MNASIENNIREKIHVNHVSGIKPEKLLHRTDNDINQN
jgi:hypothetical protein